MSKLWKNLRRLRRMGCEQSLPDEHPRIFKGKSLNDKKKTVEWVTLEGTPYPNHHVIVFLINYLFFAIFSVKDDFIVVKGRNRKVIAKWPISCLQKYGYTNNIFLLETGTSCNGGKGMFEVLLTFSSSNHRNLYIRHINGFISRDFCLVY